MEQHQLNYMARQRRDGSATFATAAAATIYAVTLLIVTLITIGLVGLLVVVVMYDQGPTPPLLIIAILAVAITTCAWGIFMIVRDMYRGIWRPDAPPSNDVSGAPATGEGDGAE